MQTGNDQVQRNPVHTTRLQALQEAPYPYRTFEYSRLTEARFLIQQSVEEYNTIGSDGSLTGMKPEQFLQRWIEGKMHQQPKTLRA